jgi:dihydrofolate synthase/folylpolyglutamate synthase
MDYKQTLDWMFTKLPMFTRIGSAAIKKDLDNTIKLCAHLDNPQHSFKSIHIAGTNGKGSVSHILASILQSAGYRTGLYTSPHLLDFRERIKVNGKEIPESSVIRFIEENKALMEQIEPSFFEMTVAMAFDYFRNEKVDYAIIETGLGGRLDSTNIITPILSVITNISYDHQNLLGESLELIAAEKAGIIKPDVPVVIGNAQASIKSIFNSKALEMGSKIRYAEETFRVSSSTYKNGSLEILYANANTGNEIIIDSVLGGKYQLENIATVLAAIAELNQIGLKLSSSKVKEGIKDVKKQTGFLGRWEIISNNPLVICDVAHNEAGLRSVFEQIKTIPHDKLRLVYGMVKDKDIEKALSLLPSNAIFYFTQPDIPRALDVVVLAEKASENGLKGKHFSKISEACKVAIAEAKAEDIVLVAGSIFVVAEALAYFKGQKESN